MTDPSEAIQAAIHAALTGSAALSTAMGGTARVYDKLPSRPTYPYIRIGDDQLIEIPNSCAGKWDFNATVHIYSHDPKEPRPQARQISSAVVGALATFGALPTPVGYRLTDARILQARDWFEGDDGLTVHRIVTVEYLVNEAA